MKFDTSRFDAAIALAHIRHPGKFGVEVTAKIGQAVRFAGPLNAHTDALQSAALLTGLVALKHRNLGSMLRVMVTSDRQDFIGDVQNNLNGLVLPDQMRQRLKRELQGFHITYVNNAEPRLLFALNNWLARSPVSLVDELPTMLSQVA